MPRTERSGATPITVATPRPPLFRVAACCLALPALWLTGTALELRQGVLSHSLVSRPERLFGAGEAAARPVLLLLVVAAVLAWLLILAGMWSRSDRPRLVMAAAVVLALAALARVGVTLFAPAGPYLYEVSEARGMAAIMLLLALPAGLALAALALHRTAPLLAWGAAAAAVCCALLGASWTWWSAYSGARQPQLWAVEPVMAVATVWSVGLGFWLVRLHSAVRAGLESRLRFDLEWPVPKPGRLASYLLVVATVAGLIWVSDPYIAQLGPAVDAQVHGRTQVSTIHVDVDRTYRVYRPEVGAASPGLVIALHPVFGSGFKMEAESHLDAQADRLGWIVAYPDGVLDGWDGFGSGTDTWGKHPGADDVAFIRALIERLKESDAIDPDRVYVTGFSRGGLGTYWIGCQLSAEVAAIAPVAGNMATAAGSADVSCHLAGPVSVLAIHGTADTAIPFAGGRTDIQFSPFSDVVAKWRSWDGCPAGGTVTKVGALTTSSWACSSGSEVAMLVVQGGCHCWPSASGAARPTGPDDFDAARVITDFFATHRRAAR